MTAVQNPVGGHATLEKAHSITVHELLPASSLKESTPASIKIKELELKGFIPSATGIENYLNIPYARITARFQEASLVDPRKERGVIDATQFGPCCPQPKDITHFHTSHLYPEMIDVENSAEFTCLNLNIFTPRRTTTTSCKQMLPVLVWIHGGGFKYGDGGCEYDGNYIVQHSVDIDKPVIVVTFNYRLGCFGFLSSQELKGQCDNAGQSSRTNLGFHDQRLAFQWVQNNIHFFGGDGSAVTAAGESAGAISLLAHLRSDFAAFQQAFILSPAALRLNDPAEAQSIFDMLVSSTTCSSEAPAHNKIDALRNLTTSQIIQTIAGSSVGPVWDNDWFVGRDQDSDLDDAQHFPSWIKSIVIGSTKEESVLLCPRFDQMTGAQCTNMLKQAFGDTDFAKEVLKTYLIEDDEIIGSATKQMIRLTSDAAFTSVAYNIVSAHSEIPISLYSFEQQDTLIAKASHLHGYSYHSLGNSMFFRLPTVTNNPEQPHMKITANAMCKAAITLAYGEQPWESYAKNKSMMVFDGNQTRISPEEKDQRWRKLMTTKQRTRAFRKGCMEIIRAGMIANQDHGH